MNKTMYFEVIAPNHPLRSNVEGLIREIYSREYDAKVVSFPKTLVAMLDDEGEILCAAGLRYARDSFFSECYLPGTIEESLSDIWKRPVIREQVAEVTCLASRKAGTSLILVQHVVNMLREQGIAWAFFTATKKLRTILRRSGVPALDVAAANSSMVSNAQEWGDYYAAEPRVVAIHDHMVSIGDAPKKTEGATALA